MKTPRRKHYKSNKYGSGVYNRESGPLEIGELETPNERRSVPVAALRYLAGSKCQTNKIDDTYSSEQSDYTDARSVESETDKEETMNYNHESSVHTSNRASHKSSDLRQLSLEHRQNHSNTSTNFAREFILRYAPNLGSDLQYYQNAKAPNQESLFHNMDYIHSHLTTFSPNFINFNYGRMNYPTYPYMVNRYSDYYPTPYLSKYSNYPNRFHEYSFHRPENYYTTNYNYFNRPENFYVPPSQRYFDRMNQSPSFHPDNYRRNIHESSTTNYSTNPNYSYTEYTSKHTQHSDHKYYLDKYNYPTDNYGQPDKRFGENKYREFETKDRDVCRKEDGASGDVNFKDPNFIQMAIEKAVKNAFDVYLSQWTNKGDETCLTDPVNREFTFDKNDTTITNKEHEEMHSGNYSNNFDIDFNEAHSNMNKFESRTDVRQNSFVKKFSNMENEDYVKSTKPMEFEFKQMMNDFENLSTQKSDNHYKTNPFNKNVTYLEKKAHDGRTFNFRFNTSTDKSDKQFNESLSNNGYSENNYFNGSKYEKHTIHQLPGDDYTHGHLFNNQDLPHEDTLDHFNTREYDSDVLSSSHLDINQSLQIPSYEHTEFTANYILNNYAPLNESRTELFMSDKKDSELYKENLIGATLSTSDLMESRNNTILGPSVGSKTNLEFDNFDTYSLTQSQFNQAGNTNNPFRKVNEERELESRTKPALLLEQFERDHGISLLYSSNPTGPKEKELYGINPYEQERNLTNPSSYSEPFYKSQLSGLKQSTNSESQQPEHIQDNNSDFSTLKKSQYNLGQVSHIRARVDNLEAYLRSFESCLKNISEQISRSNKNTDSETDVSSLQMPSTHTYTRPENITELELMEGYKAASTIKKLLHVKSMDSLIPAFTAFVQNRKG